MVLIENFNKNEKKLIFIGTSHSNNTSQINILRERIIFFDPQIILIEGGFENAVFINENEAISKGGEMGFVSYFAREKNILLSGNDPLESECIDFLCNIYGEDFTFFYFVLRNLDFLLRVNLSLSTEEKIKKVLEEFKQYSKWVDYNFSFDRFKEFFQKITNNTFDKDKTYGNYFDPSLRLLETNIATEKLSRFRDDFMIKKIKQCLLDHDRIIVLKGENHLIKCRAQLIKVFHGK